MLTDQRANLLGLMTEEFSEAKRMKKRFWYLDTAAAGASLVALGLPNKAAAATIVLGVLLKLLAKMHLSKARASHRLAERARRYDFEWRTVGWAVPERQHADLLLSFSKTVRARAAAVADRLDRDYYDVKGDPGIERLLGNLAESAFYSEKLFAKMRKRRDWQLAIALAALVLTLVGALLAGPLVPVLSFIKFLGVGTTLFVGLDVYGERSAFQRGERECRDVLAAVLAEGRRATPTREEGLRLMIEYHCLLAEMPAIPDEIHMTSKSSLEEGWAAVKRGLLLLDYRARPLD